MLRSFLFTNSKSEGILSSVYINSNSIIKLELPVNGTEAQIFSLYPSRTRETTPPSSLHLISLKLSSATSLFMAYSFVELALSPAHLSLVSPKDGG